MIEIEKLMADLEQALKNCENAKERVYNLDLKVRELEDQVLEKEHLRCSRCGTPTEKFFTCPEMTLSKFIKLIRKGERLEVVKQLRAETGWGLFDNKLLIDKIMDHFDLMET